MLPVFGMCILLLIYPPPNRERLNVATVATFNTQNVATVATFNTQNVATLAVGFPA